MKKQIRSGAVIAALVALFLLPLGCAWIQHTAQEVEYAAGGPDELSAPATTQPSTQPTTNPTTNPSAPSPALQTVRAGVGVARAVSPSFNEIAGMIAGVAGAVAGIAGHLNGKSKRKQAHTVVAEIISDVAAFKQPDQPWTNSTRKLLEDLGYADEARHEPA